MSLISTEPNVIEKLINDIRIDSVELDKLLDNIELGQQEFFENFTKPITQDLLLLEQIKDY